MAQQLQYIDVVFDGPPNHEPGRFVEVEDPDGASVHIGEWIDRGNGLWALRICQLTPNDTVEQMNGADALGKSAIDGSVL